MSSWFLINSLCCFFVSIEAVRSIVTYALLTYNRFVISFESLDQWLFGIRCTTGAIDVAITIVKTIALGYSLISIFSVWSLLYLVILCLDFKDNTWPRIMNAWVSFQLRREVKRILDSFANVAFVEINNQGVCAICQEDLLMGSGNVWVKRTPCQHYFHISTVHIEFLSQISYFSWTSNKKCKFKVHKE